MSSSELMKTALTLVNHTNIDNYKNQHVIVHGKVQSVNNNTLNLLIEPKNNHDLLINGFNKNVQAGDYLAIIGKVASDKTLDYVDMISLDKDFDLDFVNEIIPLSTNQSTKNYFERN